MKKRTAKNYLMHAAGHVWSVDAVTLTQLPDGTLALSQAELGRLHRAVANAICGGIGALSFDELEFLCDVTATTFTEVAEHLELNKSTITTWRRKGAVPSRIASNALKRWFWFRLFGAELAGDRLPLSRFRDDEAFLESATQRAIRNHATVHVELSRAP
jgi:hypothetical protein